jgi:hypothetical protein
MAGAHEEKSVVRVPERPSGLVEAGGFQMQTLDEAWRLAKAVVQGKMAPPEMDEGSVVAIWQAGAEVGLPAMTSLAKLTFINRKIGVMVDMGAGLVRAKGGLEPGTRFKVRYEGTPFEDGYTAIASAIPKGMLELCEASFSVADAKAAGLWGKKTSSGKDTPWISYPKRMLRARALGFLLRDEFAEYLGGVGISEELRDIPVEKVKERDVTPPKEPDKAFEAAVGDDSAEPPKPDQEPEDVDIVEPGEGSAPATAEPLTQEPVTADAPPPANDEEAPNITVLRDRLAHIGCEVPAKTISSWEEARIAAVAEWIKDEYLAREAAEMGVGYERKCAKRPAVLPTPGPWTVKCLKCNSTDEYPANGPWVCTNECGQRHVLGRVQPSPVEPETKPPAEPEKPTRRTLQALVANLEAIEHPMKVETVRAWSKEQKRAAWDWAADYIEWNEAVRKIDQYNCGDTDVDPGEEVGVRASKCLPKPSFIPEYGDPELNQAPAQQELAKELDPADPRAPMPDNPADLDPTGGQLHEGDDDGYVDPFDGLCMRSYDLEGSACELPEGHDGACGPKAD